jgi:response regulator RpfG family c-di-GMP phosphodiesterase
MYNHASPNVLIVEDELGPRESLRMILKPYYNVVTAESGYVAIEMVQKTLFDVITLDLKMPGISGITALKEIRKFDPNAIVIVITGYGNLQSAVKAIRYDVYDFIPKPFNIQEIISIIDKSVQWKRLNLMIKELFGNIFDQQDKTSDFKDSERDHVSFSESNHFLEFVKALTYTLKVQDPYTLGHLERVCHYTDLISKHLLLSMKERDELQVASFLHDIGKIGISNRLINKKENLTHTDWVIVKQHIKKSVEFLAPLKLSSNVLSFIQHHHEHFNGTGYPDGLMGEQIPLGGRIISIADSYDSMISSRPYRQSLSHEKAKNELLKYAGEQFDPNLVSIFLDVLDELEEEFRIKDSSDMSSTVERGFSNIPCAIFKKRSDLPKA